MSRVFIGVGSNEGDRLALISQAVQMVGAVRGIRLLQMAMIIETEPVGGPPQGPYLNTVLELETRQEPGPLLRVLQEIERGLGRTPAAQRWASRPIDLDVLLYDDRVVQQPGLTIPHPRMHERRFVLEGLVQLAPEVRHPILRETAATLLERLSQTVASTGPVSAQRAASRAGT